MTYGKFVNSHKREQKSNNTVVHFCFLGMVDLCAAMEDITSADHDILLWKIKVIMNMKLSYLIIPKINNSRNDQINHFKWYIFYLVNKCIQ